MIRFIFIIAVAIGAGILIRAFLGRTGSPPVVSEVTTSADAAIALRSLDGTTRPSKVWVDDFAGFVSAHPGQWVVGHCPQPCLSEAEAGQQARSDAAKVVWPIVAGRYRQASADTDWLRGRVTADVLAGRFDADHLAEQFQRPYGAVWTESVLLDVSPEKLDSVLDSYKVEQRHLQRRQIAIREVVTVTVIGAWLVYLFLNAVTRGYFTMRLRLAAMVVTALGVALVV
jgi:hypothetical protein